MKGICTGALALIAASTMFLGGCASDPPQVAQKEADKSNSCLGVAPATGTMVRRKEDCAGSGQGGGLPQDVQDEIRRAAQNNSSRPASLGR
jgi:hypothetical protein